jgi:hypothetical protein
MNKYQFDCKYKNIISLCIISNGLRLESLLSCEFYIYLEKKCRDAYYHLIRQTILVCGSSGC